MFGDISSGYEECKADSVAIYLSIYINLGCFDDILKVLLPSCDLTERNDIFYVVWYDVIMSGVKG